MSDLRKLLGIPPHEVQQAIELLDAHGYHVYKDGARIITDAEWDRRKAADRERREWNELLNDQSRRPRLLPEPPQ